MGERPLPTILNGKYFRVVEKLGNGNVIAQCIPCENNPAFSNQRGKKRDSSGGLKKGSFASTSNFLKHLTKHPREHDEYKKLLTTTNRNKPPDQPTVTSYFSKRESISISSDEKLQINYIIESMSPLYHVEEPSFKRLIKGLKPDARTMTYKTLASRIDRMYYDEKQFLEKTLSDEDWVCCTADIWSSRRRSFIGVTCHWITKQLKRESAVIAFKRFKGSHTYDKIAEVLDEAFKDVKLPIEKIVCCVTDNGSNFVKAFEDFGLDYPKDVDEHEPEDDGEEFDRVEHLETQTLQGGEEKGIILPMHIRCASHTLSLVATEDFIKPPQKQTNDTQTSDPVFKKVFNSAMAKCTALWNKFSRSNKVAEEIHAVCGKSLQTPCPSRWNSLFDSTSGLLRHVENFEEIFEKAGVTKLTLNDIEFLKDYVTCMEPVAKALDKLQAENNFFYGYFAPIIITTRNNLQGIIKKSGNRKHVKIMAELLIARLEKRFPLVFEMVHTDSCLELLSAIILPFFKLRWVPQDRKDAAKATFVAEAKRFSEKRAKSSSNHNNVPQPVDDFFAFETEQFNQGPLANDSIELECLNYLQDPSDCLSMLDKYPTVKAMFLYFNTPLASSAPVERLFSYAGLIFSPRRARLSDDTFKKLVFLKLRTRSVTQ